MINSTRWRQSGFTLIELVVAMGIFSAMLIVILNGFIMVTRIYDAGITSRTTQQNVRLILDDFVKNAHYSGKVDISHSPQVCLFKGTNTIFYALDSSGNLWRTTTSAFRRPSVPGFHCVAPMGSRSRRPSLPGLTVVKGQLVWR